MYRNLKTHRERERERERFVRSFVGVSGRFIKTGRSVSSFGVNHIKGIMSTTEIEEHNDVSSGGLLPELRQICLQNLDSFTSIVSLNDHGGKLNFKMLNHLQVTNCNNLEYLFPSYVLNDLHQLKNIEISDCKKLKQVFWYKEQDAQTMNSIVVKELPLLKSLKLSRLPELASICSGAVTSGSLNQMAIENCPKFIFTFARSVEEQEPSDQNKSKEMIVTPSKLENLILCEVDHLKKMGKDRWPIFMHMTSLQLKNCNGLEYLFSLSMAQKLSSLQELKITSCQMIEQIVKRESEERTIANTTVEFPQVKTLTLDRLPKLTGLSSSQDGVSVKWLELSNVEVTECPNIKKSRLGMVDRPLLKRIKVTNCSLSGDKDRESIIAYIFDLTDELSKLEELTIEDSKKLKKYMEMQLQESSFARLKTIKVLQCDNELNKFLSILLCRSYNVEELKVENCELLEMVFDLTEVAAIEPKKLKFPNLKTMQLIGLRKLNCVWNNNPRGILGLGKLGKLEIIKCGLLKSALSITVLEELVLLEVLKIELCEMMEQVVEDDKEIQESSFPKLKDLQLVSLPKLIKFNSGHCNFKFPSLESVTIENCPKLNVLSNQWLATEGTSNQVPINEMMQCPCSMLKRLKLAGLEMMEDMSQGRIPLYELGDVEVDSFSRLTSMWIAKSEKLKTLVVRNCSTLGLLVLPSKCINLTKIKISNCKVLKKICTEAEQEKTNEKTFGGLESIIFENLPVLSFFSLETCKFPSLKEMTIVSCPMLKTLPRNVSAKEDAASLVLFDTIKDDSPAGECQMKIPSKLESLELTDLPNMQLWKQEPESSVFRNLTIFKIMRCTRIKMLFSIPVAQHLSVLKLLTLYGCENMVQVLGGGGGNGKQVFQKLETLVLKHLPNLTSFCEENVDFEFPELKMVRLEDVPNMMTFVKKSLETPKLEHVHVTPITKCWQGNLNQTISFLHNNREKLEGEVWKSDQSSTRHHADTAESSSQASRRIKGSSRDGIA